MKPITRVFTVLIAATLLARSQDEVSAVSRESVADPVPTATTARVLGPIPDGTPPPPAPQKPGFTVPTKDIIVTKTHQQGGRTITVREIAPVALPPPPPAPAPVDINDPVWQQRIADRRDRNPAWEPVFIGATVYRSGTSPARTRVHLWPRGKGEPVVFWSSADFSLLSGLSSFQGSDGLIRSLMMSWSVEDSARRREILERYGKQYSAPEPPDFPAGKATFAITSEAPTAEALATIQSLHDLYNNEQDRLKTAYEGRERARLQQAVDLKANPPQPKDIVLNYWFTDSADQAPKGGAR